jgi:hypothetical protein
MAYVVTDTSLPLSLDVQVSVSKLATLGRLNLSNICIVGENLGLLPDANRIRFYSTLASVGIDFATTSDVYLAATAFFAQSPRPAQLTIGEAFSVALRGHLVAATLSSTELTALALITSGSMTLTVDNTAYNITGMNFHTIAVVEDVATIIQAALTAGAVPATCYVKTLPGGQKRLAIATTGTGASQTVLFPIAYSTGVFAGDALNFTAVQGGSSLPGYTPTDIAGELDNIQNAATSAGQFIYGWCLTKPLRSVATQTVAAAWALSQDMAMMPLVTNDITALDPSYTTDLGSVLKPLLNKRAVAIYSNNLDDYPDVSILAYMLSVNYQAQNSTVTAKFKQLPGVNTVALTLTQWSVLENKGYNTYTLTGLNAQVWREGGTADVTTPWFMDTVINMDNFVEDLSVNIYNVFLRNGKVPYTATGQMMLVDACSDTGNQYVYNGTFADRQVTDLTEKSGVATLPAVVITPTPINQMSVSSRASRVGPPISMVVQEAGAIHSIAVAVQLVS